MHSLIIINNLCYPFLAFDEIDYNFYEEFLNCLFFQHIRQNKKELLKGFKTNTVGKNIKRLIIFKK